MVTRRAANDGFEARWASIERVGGSPLLADVAPISGALGVLVSEVKAVGAESGFVLRGSEMLAKLDFKVLKEFQCSFDEERV